MSEKTLDHVQEFEYKAEMKQLLHLIIHSLYTNKDIFLRELISNASDALNKFRFRSLTDKDNLISPDEELKIKVMVDKDAHTFSIEDNGIGMTVDDLTSKIGTVASSGTLEFLERLKKDGKSFDANIIGQFGVGFYSVFLVADEVMVETRHADKNSKAYRWLSKGESTYSIEEIDMEHRGTKISFTFKEDSFDYAEDYRIKSIITTYSKFIDFPIYLKDEKVNTVTALWQRPKSEVKDEEIVEFYKFISNDFAEPLGHLQISAEGTVNVKAMLFIPERAPFDLFYNEDSQRLPHLYSNKVFIQDDCKDLLPDYLRFISGVVDTEDLPLNVSREVTQLSPVMTKIRNILTSKILGLLEEWSKNDEEKYLKFYTSFGPLFKRGIHSDLANKEKLIELLRFESTKKEKGKFTSLKDYVSRAKPDQSDIFYLSGESRDLCEKNPNLEYFRKEDIEVLLVFDPYDIYMMPLINEYDKKAFKSIDRAEINLDKADNKEDALNTDRKNLVIKEFKKILKEKVEDVVESKRLVDSAVTLVVGKDGMDAQMEKMMKMMNKDFTGSKKLLEINMSHNLIKNLAQLIETNQSEDLVSKSVLQLYEGALLINGELELKTDFVKRMTELLEISTSTS